MLSEHSIKTCFLLVPQAGTSVYTVEITVFHKFVGCGTLCFVFFVFFLESLCDRYYPIFSIQKHPG